MQVSFSAMVRRGSLGFTEAMTQQESGLTLATGRAGETGSRVAERFAMGTGSVRSNVNADALGARTGQAEPRLPGTCLAAASVGAGLMAGLFFAFDVGVMPGLAKVDDAAFVSTMQHINREIENGLFGLVFIGAFLAVGTAAVLQHRLGRHRVARLVWRAFGLYALMVVVTFTVNIPLNTALAQAGSSMEAMELPVAREAFEKPWRAANVVRTLASAGALCFLGRALVLHGRSLNRGRK